jgi:phosphopantothenoylcysteine decarboxylase
MKNIILGVTASVAAIKIKNLAESLAEFCHVRIVITNQAEYFINAELAALAARHIPIYRDQDEWPALEGPYQVGMPILHIEMRRWADCLVIAPMDANTLAKIASGFCDNLLTSIFRAWDWQKPAFLCPAMNTMMWDNPPTQAQINFLRSWGAQIIEPIEKKLACNDVGMGGMANVEEIVNVIRKILG